MMDEDHLLDAMGAAIERARCPGREGPYGGYDYGFNTDFYGAAPEAGRYVVCDFRDPTSPDWGKWVHQTPDELEHDAALARFTRRHIAKAALDVVRALASLPTSKGRE